MGWSTSFKNNEFRKKEFIQMMSKNMDLHKEDEHSRWFFTEVLDNLMLYYVISIEIK